MSDPMIRLIFQHEQVAALITPVAPVDVTQRLKGADEAINLYVASDADRNIDDGLSSQPGYRRGAHMLDRHLKARKSRTKLRSYLTECQMPAWVTVGDVHPAAYQPELASTRDASHSRRRYQCQGRARSVPNQAVAKVGRTRAIRHAVTRSAPAASMTTTSE